jgi:hypothetical protein
VKKIVFLFFIFCTLSSFSQNKKYIINFYGAELKEKPNWNSKTIAIIEVGDSILLQKNQIQITQSSVLKDSLYIKGYWVKVKHKSTIAYLFDGHISTVKPTIHKAIEPKDKLYIQLLGNKTATVDSIKIHKYSHKSHNVKYTYITYENGQEVYSLFDGCDSHKITFHTLNFNQVYHHMLNSIWSYGTSYDTKKDSVFSSWDHPVFQKVTDGTYFFNDVGLIENIQISKNSKNQFVLSYGGCD